MNRRFFFKAAAAVCAAPLLPAVAAPRAIDAPPVGEIIYNSTNLIQGNVGSGKMAFRRKVLIGVGDGMMNFWDPQTGEHWTEQSTDVHSFRNLAEGTQRAVANNYRLSRRMNPLLPQMPLASAR